MTMRQMGNRWLMGLTLAAAASGACTDEGSSGVNADELTTQLQAELEAGATLNAATAASVRPVRPALKCVDKLSSTSYRAHFSYTNTSSSSIPIPVGFFNRFFPDPSNRGQPTTYAAGTHADVVQVTFSSSSFVAWVLGSGVVAATRTSTLCPTGTGGATGTGGSGTGGRGGGAGSGTGGVGVGGSGAGGAAVCPSSCDDHNPCTIDLCNASTAFKCSNVATRDGTACDDGNACTNLDTCLAGVCTAGPAKICAALDQCHVAGVCNSATGACSNPNAAEGLACNDGNLCTAADACRSGVCTGGTTTVCTALDQCHGVGVCVPATGLCPNPVLADGTSCNDGNVCTTGDACRAGVCTPQVTLTASHCSGAACDQCSFDVGTDICSTSPDGCFNCVPSTDGCDMLTDPTDRQLCEDAYGCFTSPANNCIVQGDVTACWCGTNVGTCQTDNTAPTMANGPCLDVITRAARLTAATYDAPSILLHLTDPDFPLGRAVNLVTCRANFCSAECGVH